MFINLHLKNLNFFNILSIRILSCVIFFLSCSSIFNKDLIHSDSSSMRSNSSELNSQKEADLFELDFPGQYVIYHDERGGRNNLVGILKFNKTEYIARQFNIDTQQELILDFKALSYPNGRVDYRGGKIYKGNDNEALFLLTDLANMISQYGEYRKQSQKDVDIIDKWPEFGYTLVHSYKFWIPLFHLYETKKENESQNFLKILFVGRMLSENDTTFFSMRSIPLVYKTAEFEIESFPKTNLFKAGIFTIHLDQNWIRYKDPNNPNPDFQGFLISKKSKRDAQVSVEIIPKKHFPYNIEVLAKIGISFNSLVEPESVSINKIGDTYKVSFMTLDPKSLNETYMYLYYKPDGEGNINIFHLSAYRDTYESNKNYFDTIIESVQ